MLFPLFLHSWGLSKGRSENTERMLGYVEKLAETLIPGRRYTHTDKQFLI